MFLPSKRSLTPTGTPICSVENRRILVVDDSRAIHDDFQKLLGARRKRTERRLAELEADFFGAAPMEARVEFEIDSALSGEAGREMVCKAVAARRPYALAFVDMRMPPGWDGLETISRIWSDDEEIQIVICTAFQDHSWADIIERLGTSDRLLILKKPFEGVEVAQMAYALSGKWMLAREVRQRLSDLEERVMARTRDLSAVNDRLRKEGADRERLEHELRIAQRLESVGRLAAGIAHEINNPLSCIIGNLRFIGEQLAGPTRSAATQGVADGISEALRDANEGALRVRDIVRDMKSMARSDDQSIGPVDLEAALESSIRITLNQIRPRARLVRDFQPLPPVIGNHGRFAQLFLNLLVNATQAIAGGSPDNHEIRVGTRFDSEGLVTIEICDTGCGIPAEHRARIFDPFFTTRAIGEGTGLGLSICHGIVADAGGRIVVDSAAGRGTSIRILLPCAA